MFFTYIYLFAIFFIINVYFVFAYNTYDSQIFYQTNLLNHKHNLIVLQPSYNTFMINKSTYINPNITLHYKQYINDDYFNNIINQNNIDGIFTNNDHVICQKNQLSQKYFNRTNIDLNYCSHLDSKKTIRDFLSKYNKINKVPSVIINADDYLMDNIKKVKFDNFIVKPTYGSGSSGVFHMYYKNDILVNFDKFKYEFNNNPFIKLNNQFIVEKFIGGTEHNLDLVIYNNKIYFWHISDDLIDFEYFQDIGTLFPSKLENDQKIEMFNQAQLILKYLNIKNGVYHFEFKVENNKSYLIELNPRMPGGGYVKYISNLYGSNLEYDEILIALGKKPFYNNKAINMIIPKKQICDREYYAHILDENSIGTILLNNKYYYDILKSTKNIEANFFKQDYDIIKLGNDYDHAIYNIHTHKIKNACDILNSIDKPNYVSIYKLNDKSKIDQSNVIEIFNNSIQTVKFYDKNEIFDISQFLNSNNLIYLFDDKIKCHSDKYNCLYIPDLNNLITTYNYTYNNSVYKIPKHLISQIKNQKNIGSCQIFATLTALEMIHNNTINFSELGTYYINRFAKIGGIIYNEYINSDDKKKYLKNIIKSNYDTGSYNKNILDTLLLYGTCLESTYKYDTKKINNDIPFKCVNEALNYKINDYHYIENPWNNRNLIMNEIKYFINNNIPVIFGLQTFYPWWNSDDFFNSGKLELPKKYDKIENGDTHAMIFVGYDDNREIFWYQNSFGNNFGVNLYSEKREFNNNGFGYITYDYLFTKLYQYTTYDNEYFLDGFIVVLSQYNNSKLNHINPNVEIKYDNSYSNSYNIKFESVKQFLNEQIDFFDI